MRLVGGWQILGGKKCRREGKVGGVWDCVLCALVLWWKEDLGCLHGVGGGGVAAWICVEVDVEVGDCGCVGFAFNWWKYVGVG